MVKILAFGPNYTNAKNLDVDNLMGLDYGQMLPASDVWPKRMRIKLNSKTKPHHYFPIGPLRLVSSDLMNVCLEFDVKAEFLPVQLLAKDGTKHDARYYYCHILDSVDCFDTKKSKCTYRDKEKTWIDEIRVLVIDEKKASGHHLFRIDVSSFIIAASDEFAEAVQRLKLKGPVFMDPKEWSAYNVSS